MVPRLIATNVPFPFPSFFDGRHIHAVGIGEKLRKDFAGHFAVLQDTVGLELLSDMMLSFAGSRRCENDGTRTRDSHDRG